MTIFVEVFNYSFYIFQNNFAEFDNAIDNYTKELARQEVSAFLLKNRNYQIQNFEKERKEINRLLHNYLASWYSLKQQTYAVEKSLTDQSIISQISSKKGEMFKDNPENGFIQDLRNYVQHRSLPLVENQSVLSLEVGQQDFNIEHSLYLDTNNLLKWDKWTNPAKRYLTDHSEKIPIKEVIKNNFSHIENFYRWLEKQVSA